MLKRSMELNADLQEENAAMMEERSSLQGPSESKLQEEQTQTDRAEPQAMGEETSGKISLSISQKTVSHNATNLQSTSPYTSD